MIGTSRGAVLEGIEATPVLVEADVSPGLPHFHIVGLPDSAVSESKLRIRSAIRNSGLQFPGQRITVNLSPASLRKRGPGLDLAIAVAILRASGQIPNESPSVAANPRFDRGPLGFCAELGLSGQLVPVGGLVNLVIALRNGGVNDICLSRRQAEDCVGLPGVSWYPFDNLQALVQVLLHRSAWPQPVKTAAGLFGSVHTPDFAPSLGHVDMADVQGLDNVKRALTVAAVGGLHVLLVGPPGCGKTMVAERFPGILPPLGDEAALEVYAIHRAAGLDTPASRTPPCRSPHHSVTAAGLVGGGMPLLPGEVTLAHRGVLLLDEMPEFDRHALNALREPLVSGQVRLARAGRTTRLPAAFTLVGTMNPCPCGARGSGECRCSEYEVERYWSRLSGPLLDRIDLLIYVAPTPYSANTPTAETSRVLRERVVSARQLLCSWQDPPAGRVDERLPSRESLQVFPADVAAVLGQAVRGLGLSQRAAASVRRTARAIAALDGRLRVQSADVYESLGLRSAAPSGAAHPHYSSTPR